MKDTISKQYMLNLYSSFSCMAGGCPFTCCSGWLIEISAKDYERFRTLEPVNLRKKVLENVENRKGKYYFRNRENGDCAMLLQDQLCYIQKHASEQTLCNTCRKYPRIYGEAGEIIAFSMAASCPVVAHAIWKGHIFLYQKTEEGLLKAAFSELPFCKEVFMLFHERRGRKNVNTYSEIFENLTDHFLDVLLSEKIFLKKQILELFSFYEREQTQEYIENEILIFLREQKENYERIGTSYIPYRAYSRWLEAPEETVWDMYVKIYGELFFCVYIGFLAAQKFRKEVDWVWVICICYRLTVHEKKLGGELFLFFKEYLEEIEAIVQGMAGIPLTGV